MSGIKEVLRKMFGVHAEILSDILYIAMKEDEISFEQIKRYAGKDAEDILVEAFEMRLLIPVGERKTFSWEDSFLRMKEDEKYRIPNIVKYILQEAEKSGKMEIRKAVERFFKEMGEKEWKKIADLVEIISKSKYITGADIKMICEKIGIGERTSSIILELKGAGIISPCLRNVSRIEVSPIYEINPFLSYEADRYK